MILGDEPAIMSDAFSIILGNFCLYLAGPHLDQIVDGVQGLVQLVSHRILGRGKQRNAENCADVHVRVVC